MAIPAPLPQITAIAVSWAYTRKERLADLAGYPIVCMPSDSGIHNLLDQACTAQGMRPDIAMEASAAGAVADLAGRGLGVAILSESMTASQATCLGVLPIDDVDIPALLR